MHFQDLLPGCNSGTGGAFPAAIEEEPRTRTGQRCLMGKVAPKTVRHVRHRVGHQILPDAVG
jgi:hypothetical protein